MDHSYLHKKFKKQQCVEPKSHNVQHEKEVTSNIQNKENENSEALQQTAQCSEIVHDYGNGSNNSVPIHSTNNQNSLNLSAVPPHSLVKSSISEVSNLAERTERALDTRSWNNRSTSENDIVNSQFPNNGISYVNSNQNQTTFVKQPNFDTKINDYEPTPSTSSILENLYSKSNYVTSKLVNFIKADETSASVSVDKNYYNEDVSVVECKSIEKKDVQDGSSVPDKTSGGKYVCNYCNLVCSKPSVLQKHIRAHTNERPFPCVSCGFSFKTRSNLYKHCRSRTHANRVMGNKAQEISNEMDVDSQTKPEYPNHASPQNHHYEVIISSNAPREDIDIQPHETSIVQDVNQIMQDVRQKPYKPRFKAFFDGMSKENAEDNSVDFTQTKTSNPHLLSLHINELIHKNNSIVNSNDVHLIRKRNVDNYYVDNVNNNEYALHKYNENSYLSNNNDEPLNLTNKNRKRCLSEVTEPAAQKSLIKELLLKNLYADTNKQCPYCKMIFQTVTELDLHKLRSCKGFTKSGARYSRSSSVNVASILTQNKNAFDTNPHVPNTVFPLKSPGPFLGKTRLVESDKAKSFSFDDGIQKNFQSSFQSPNDLLRASQRYSLSPLTLQTERTKKIPVKLFGGEVKITHTSGETKSFKIDGKEDQYCSDTNFEYGNKLSENRVVKSTLQSGGTVLQNKPAYNKQDSLRSSPDVIRVYDNASASPGIEVINLEKTKLSFDRQSQNVVNAKSNTENSHRSPSKVDMSAPENVSSPSYKYTNIMDFSQKAVKLFAPNIKQPNLTIPGLPIPSKLSIPLSVDTKIDILSTNTLDNDQHMDISPVPAYTKEMEIEKGSDFTSKQIWLEQKISAEPLSSPKMFNNSNVCAPMNLLVNGKVVRYVPGIPGPIIADTPMDIAYASNIIATTPRNTSSNLRLQRPNIKITPVDSTPPPRSPFMENYSPKTASYQNAEKHGDLRPTSTSYPQVEKNRSPKLEVRVDGSPKSSNELKSPKNDAKSPNHQAENPRKFARPNSLALKPSMSVLKQHHGLTPTMFNQILISPDTPRVAKKYNHQILHGNYFSYLGLKSSTKSVYCTLNKTQPFYVPHFKKLSMYSEWRQQDNKSDKLYVSAYDSRQKLQKYTTAGKTTADLIVHSSYKFTISEISTSKEEVSKSILMGGYESNEDYTYVRGRGRGRYVCDQCGIRCKKPSMLKKHIRTHSNDRPYTCGHCNFSFKTKGNLTKHMKSKAHTKNSAVNSGSSNSSAQQSGTPSSDSDTEDSGMDSSDESTRQQEHEAAYGLLSLSQKPASNTMIFSQSNDRIPNLSLQQNTSSSISLVSSETMPSFMDTEQIAHVTKTNYAKNKILDQQTNRSFNPLKFCEVSINADHDSRDSQHMTQFLGKSNANRPLTYPYTTAVPSDSSPKLTEYSEAKSKTREWESPEKNEPKNIRQFSVVKEWEKVTSENTAKRAGVYRQSSPNYEAQSRIENINNLSKHLAKHDPNTMEDTRLQHPVCVASASSTTMLPDSPQNLASDLRKRKVASTDNNFVPKIQKNDSEVMDLSMSSAINEKKIESQGKQNGFLHSDENEIRTVSFHNNKISTKVYVNKMAHKYDLADVHNSSENEMRTVSFHNKKVSTKAYVNKISHKYDQVDVGNNFKTSYSDKRTDPYDYSRSKHASAFMQKSMNQNEMGDDLTHYNNSTDDLHRRNENEESVDESVHMETDNYVVVEQALSESPNSFKTVEYDNSAMETLADIATKQVKLEKNSVAKNVATEFLILATKNEYQNREGLRDSNNFISGGKDMNELIVKPEENKNCTICSKSFIKPSQLRLHMNIHYLERPFRCDSCSVSFRTKGHLQKHERSAGHHNKLSSSPTLSSSEPRPFKCSDCNIAFRIHGHLAKHLRSKMHIMKLECLAKIPFGLYAELERSNSLLTEINTTDGEQCLESLKMLAKKVFINDPNKLNQLGPSLIDASVDNDS